MFKYCLNLFYSSVPNQKSTYHGINDHFKENETEREGNAITLVVSFDFLKIKQSIKKIFNLLILCLDIKTCIICSI